MNNEFARHALVAADGTSLTTADRLRLALNAPESPGALSQHHAKAVTQNRIRAAFSELAHGNIANVHDWLQQVALTNPAKAVELFIEVAQFSLPRLKAVAIDVRSGDGSVKTLSVQDLERIVAEG